MSQPDPEVLIGRLALHYKILSKEKVSEALRGWRAEGADEELGAFMVARGYLKPEVLQKLERAKAKYLERERGADTSAPGTVAPPTTESAPATASATPVASQPQDAPAFVVETVPAPSAPEPAAASAPEASSVSAQTTAGTSGLPAAYESHPEWKLRFGPGTTLEKLLRQTQAIGASDLHVHSGARIKIRLHGRLLDTSGVLDASLAEQLILSLLTEEQRDQLEEYLQPDFSYSIPGIGRFRANVYRQQRGLDAVFRAIPPQPPSLADLGLPETLSDLISFHQGIVLLTGPAGCGKSSTMAALVRLINEQRPDHIITVEDPIEYVHSSLRCVVNQREVGPHTESFARALRAALREDPDIIAIGELRDLETISLALTAAETGHLVLGTLHTSNAIRTVNRVLGVFPPDQQAQIRMMFSESLRAIVSQRLLPQANGQGRVAAIEVLMNTKAVSNLIREQKTFQLHSIMQTGSQYGMCLLDHSLAALVKEGRITKETAQHESEKPESFS